MVCSEVMELENIWRQRYEGARLAERGGLFAVPAKTSSRAEFVRQHRARQAQAARAILLHQKSCAVCGSSDGTHNADLLESRAS